MAYVFAKVDFANAVPINNNDPSNNVVTSIPLVAGDWQVGGSCGVKVNPGGAISHVHMDTGIGNTIETSPADGATSAIHVNLNQENGIILPIGLRRYICYQPTTVNLRASATFSGSGFAYGTIWAFPTPADITPPPPLPPPSPGIDQYTKLMLHCDGSNGSTTLTDSALTPHTVTPHGSAQCGTARLKFGSAGLALANGAGAYLTLASDPDFTLAGDFALDMWVWTNDASADNAYRRILSMGGHDTGGIEVMVATTGAISVYAAVAERIRGTSNIANGTFNHIALTRSGSSIRLFVNGVQEGSTYTSSATFGSGQPVYIGRYPNSAVGHFNGSMDEIRISNGSARWTANFTPPPQPYSI